VKGSALIHYWLNVALGLLALLLWLSSFLLWVVFPLGYFPSRMLWLEIHKWSGLAVSIGVVIHLLLHLNWIIAMTERVIGRRGKKGYPQPSPSDFSGRVVTAASDRSASPPGSREP
jgi:hypothetical protein